MNIFKKCIALVALSVMTVSAFAQEDSVVFNPHFSLQLQGGAGYTIGEADFSDLLSPAVAVNLGYQFTPVVGGRFGLSGIQGKGGFYEQDDLFKFNYVQANVDVVIDLMNWFAGYKYDRTVNPYIFAGVGLNFAFNNDEATELYNDGALMGKYWENSSISPAGRLGLGVDFRVSEKVSIGIEANANALSDNFNSKTGSSVDWQFNGLVGLKIRFGSPTKTVAKAVPYVAPAPEPAPAPAPAPRPAPAPAPAPAPKAEPQTFNVFFGFDSATITSTSDDTLDDVAAYMKANPSTSVALTGYADARTGASSYNSILSERRADSVKAALESKGISSSRISTDSKGDSVQPFSVNAENRVVVCIVE